MSSSSTNTAQALNVNLQILSIMIFNFANYLTIGLPLAVLPSYVHGNLGFSAFWAGVVISMQYFATLLSRPHAGRYADLLGAKRVVLMGLSGCFLSGVFYLLALWKMESPVMSLALLCIGRLVLGVGQSFAGTGSTLWGIGRVGSLHIGKVISWSGVMTYGAMAVGAPLGVWIFRLGGLGLLAAVIMAIALAAILLAISKEGVQRKSSNVIPFRQVLGKILPYGVVLGLATSGFGVIATFITLFYEAKSWSGGAFALTLFSSAFVAMRLLFPNVINRFGGQKVALICFLFEALGLLLVWVAPEPLLALTGAMLTGAGFSLVFPALGVVAVKRLPQENQGSALATYTAFMDLSLGITGPLAGLLIAHAGISSIYLAAAFAVILSAALILRLVRKEQGLKER
ncbi:MFS transporter [Rouxiella sp. T17]|uniref:MFS transporter n=1 Tax=Rouxiella sp. T17 TaxID=3085684 RepID=UPI002FCBCEDE